MTRKHVGIGATLGVAIAMTACGNPPTAPGPRALQNETTPPTVVVSAPVDFSVGRPTVNVVASCTTSSGEPCDLYISAGFVTIFSGRGSVNFSYDISRTTTFRFQAADQSGGVTNRYRTVYYAPSTGLGWLADAPGRVVDYDGTRVLFESIGDSTSSGYLCCARAGIFDLTTHESASFALPRGIPTAGWLWNGEAFVWASDDGASAPLFEFDGVSLTVRAGITSLQVNGRYAIIGTTSGTFLRDLTSGLETASPFTAEDRDPRVAPNGDVVYWREAAPFGVFRWRNGAVTSLSTYHGDRKPISDGTNVIFQRPHGVLALVDGTNFYQELGAVRYDVKEPVDDYVLNLGWSAYTRLNDIGIPQIWTRSPGGVRRQRAAMTGRAAIEGVNGTGGVVFKVADRLGPRRYFVAADQALTPLPVDGRVVNRDGDLVLLLGRSVFRILPAATP
jgi:hypothetical protein